MQVDVKDLYDFKSCPLRYKFTKIDKVCRQVTANDGVRESLQAVLNYYFFHLKDGVQLPLSELKEKFSSIWFGNLELYDIYMPDKREKRKKELEAIGMLNTFYRQQQYSPDVVVVSDLPFRVPFGDNFFVTGKLPLVRETPRGMELVIHKMGNHKYDEFWQKTDMGITLSAMAYHSMFKEELNSIAIQVLKDGSTIYVNRKKEDYKRLIKTVNFMKESIQRNWLLPRETNACTKCPAKNLCMEWK